MTESKTGNFLTRTKAFQKIADMSFDVCDFDKKGVVGKSELYAGVILVHLNLAKYAGPAACYPPLRATVNTLFDASDGDKSGTIDREEFRTIVEVCCAQIMSRIITYYAVLIFVVPWLATKVVDILKIAPGSYQEMAAEQMTSMSIFFLIIPHVLNYIDNRSHEVAKERSIATFESKKAD